MGYRLISPQDDLDHAFDWTDFLNEVGSPDDAISSSEWRLVPDEGSPGAEVHDATVTVAGGVVSTQAYVRGATRGRVYLLLNKVTTVIGRTKEQSCTLVCEGES